MKNSNKFAFLKLPYELRDMIYKFALPRDPHERQLGNHSKYFKSPLAKIPEISQTCKQIRQETLPIWLGQHKFLVKCEALLGDRLFERWLHTLGPCAVFIKEVVIHLEIYNSRFLVPYEPYGYGAGSFIGVKIHRGSISSLSGVERDLFRSLRVDKVTRALDRFSSTAESRGEAIDTIDRIARRLTPYQPANSYITFMLERIVDIAGDFGEGKMMYFVVRGREYLY
ncbi:hypothetical protein MBLNU457_6386t1 [Dothideomycetes sp. NU457]